MFGKEGDFITAPDISQTFGEVCITAIFHIDQQSLGVWLLSSWMQAGRPSPVRLVELGPGRGGLLADVLRVSF